MKYLCIIPARGGSKGIKQKNIIDVCGKPLISYTIQVAMQAAENGLFEKTIVSTDCETIADISRKCGANVPFIRPAKIAEDKSKSIDFVLHSLDFYRNKGVYFDAVVILQPTSPLRSYENLKEAIELFNRNTHNSLISGYTDEAISDLVLYYKEMNQAVALNKNHNKGGRRQDHKAIYLRNGAVYITKVTYLKKHQQIISDSPLMYEMNKYNSINIDSYDDLQYVRYILCK